MSRQDWFRNVDWSPLIETEFYQKLKRARSANRAQYLCLQANHLTDSHPEVALRLLDEYFTLGDRFNASRAHMFRAKAWLALGNINNAIDAYEAALAREKEYPNAQTPSCIELPFLIATEKVGAKYGRALEVLANPRHLMFPRERFQYHAALALILNEVGQSERAREHARAALQQAEATDSGLRYHAALGLVGNAWEDVRQRVVAIAAG